jgi:uncharacterized protein
MIQLSANDIAKIKFFFTQKPVKKAYLFGSFARKDATKTSDIDLLVEFESGMNLFKLIAIKQELEQILDKTVDLVSSNGLNSRISKYINYDKQLIYEK